MTGKQTHSANRLHAIFLKWSECELQTREGLTQCDVHPCKRRGSSESSHTFRRNVICLKIDRTWKTPNELKLKCPLIMKLLRLFYFYTPAVVGSCERSRISTWPKREQSTKTTHCKYSLSRSTAGETHHCSPCRATIKADVRLGTVLSAQLGGQANTPIPRGEG